MRTPDQKYIMIVLAFIISWFLAWSLFFRYQKDDKVNINLFPKTIGEWTSEDLKITDEEYAILETRNAFVRKYRTPSGKEIYLFIVYSESNRKVSHPPEICYIGNGISVLGRAPVTMQWTNPLRLNANKLLLEMGNARQVTYYWFKVGNSYTPSYWKQQLLIAVKTLFGQPSSSALIRISSTIHESESQAENEIREFSTLIVSDLVQYLP